MLLRAAFLIGRLLLKPEFAKTPQDISTISLGINFKDCDCNGHVNNARYLTFLDWARFQLFFEQRLWSFSKERYYPIVQNTEITYIRPIFPSELCSIKTRLLWWDDKYIYIEHHFYVGAELRTHARCRAVVFKGRQQRQALLTLLAQPPKQIQSLELWVNYLNMKKKESAAFI